MKQIIIVVAVMLYSTAAFAQSNVFHEANDSLKPIQKAITAAKRTDAKRFQYAQKIPAEVAKLDAKKRGPFLPLGKHFTNLGSEMVLPLASLVISEYTAPTIQGSARTSFLVGTFEAFANIGDTQVVPVMLAAIQSDQNHYVVRAATESVGRLGSDADIAALLEFADSNDVRAGLRGCRRQVCADFLALFLKRPLDKNDRLIALKSLGSIGNAWAWSTSEVKAKDNGETVRLHAMEALVEQYASATDVDIKRAARKAILVVDHPMTTTKITALRDATKSETQRASLDDLARRVAKNPTR